MSKNSLEDLESRSYKTYKSRLHASRRLTARQHAWNTFLIALALSTAVASIGLLVDPKLYGDRGDVLLTCISVAALVASLVVPSLNYSGRARDMFSSYRRIQRVSAEAERLLKAGVDSRAQEALDLYETYETLLDESENHNSADFAKAIKPPSGSDEKTPFEWGRLRDWALSLAPYLALLLPATLLTRLGVWLLGG